MTEKTLIREVKEAAETVRHLEEQLEQARLERAQTFTKARQRGMTQQQIADYAQVSIQTVQSDHKLTRTRN